MSHPHSFYIYCIYKYTRDEACSRRHLAGISAPEFITPFCRSAFLPPLCEVLTGWPSSRAVEQVGQPRQVQKREQKQGDSSQSRCWNVPTQPSSECRPTLSLTSDVRPPRDSETNIQPTSRTRSPVGPPTSDPTNFEYLPQRTNVIRRSRVKESRTSKVSSVMPNSVEEEVLHLDSSGFH